jgi:hypothetical protein
LKVAVEPALTIIGFGWLEIVIVTANAGTTNEAAKIATKNFKNPRMMTDTIRFSAIAKA